MLDSRQQECTKKSRETHSVTFFFMRDKVIEQEPKLAALLLYTINLGFTTLAGVSSSKTTRLYNTGGPFKLQNHPSQAIEHVRLSKCMRFWNGRYTYLNSLRFEVAYQDVAKLIELYTCTYFNFWQSLSPLIIFDKHLGIVEPTNPMKVTANFAFLQRSKMRVLHGDHLASAYSTHSIGTSSASISTSTSSTSTMHALDHLFLPQVLGHTTDTCCAIVVVVWLYTTQAAKSFITGLHNSKQNTHC